MKRAQGKFRHSVFRDFSVYHSCCRPVDWQASSVCVCASVYTGEQSTEILLIQLESCRDNWA